MTERRDDELEALLAIAREAARLVCEVYATPFEVEHKTPGDPVTRADREANALICARLAARFPGDAIIAEESAPRPEDVAALTRRPRVFFVDPLDGTRDFVARTGEFATMIGLAERGRASVGVVVLPTQGLALAGRVDGVAFAEAADGSRRPLRLSDEHDPRVARVMVSRSRAPRILDALEARLGVHRRVPCGSVGAKIARILTGEAELYVHGGGKAQLWDTCGPEAILRAAGGALGDLRGDPLDYGASELTLHLGIVAATPALFDPVVAITRDEVARYLAARGQA